MAQSIEELTGYAEPPPEPGRMVAPRSSDRAWSRVRRWRRSEHVEGALFPRGRLSIGAWVLLFCAVEIVYLFVVSAGRFVDWPVYTTYYDFLAEGFRSGQLHLSVPPSPELLAKADPYARENLALWLWDVSLFNGKYYLYWGPVPALLLAAVKILFRISAPVSDGVLLFAFETLRVAAGAILLEKIGRRLFPNVRPFFVAAAVLVFAFANPVPHTLARAAIYEAAIVGGQAFLVTGLVFAFDAVWTADPTRLKWRRLVVAGVCWGLAVGCRASLAPAVAIIILVSTPFVARPGFRWQRWRRLARTSLQLGAPPAAAVLGLLIYNRARFGAWFDFGLGRQLTTMPFKASTEHLSANFLSYLARPFGYSCKFPFVRGVLAMGDRAFPEGFKLADGYWNHEPVIGVLNGVPWSWFAVVPIVVGATAIFRRLRRRVRRWPEDGEQREIGSRSAALLWCLITSGVIATIGMVGVIAEFMASMRFLNDGITGGVLFSTLGAWMLVERCRHRPRLRMVIGAAVVLLAAASIGIGWALGFTGPYGSHFTLANPDLYYSLSDKLSVCRR